MMMRMSAAPLCAPPVGSGSILVFVSLWLLALVIRIFFADGITIGFMTGPMDIVDEICARVRPRNALHFAAS